ncbi:MAG: hypothetical protein NDI62_00965 [Burkholderiales bacterium]|nr:hypothetical protein [Burkholderiales bacterium]
MNAHSEIIVARPFSSGLIKGTNLYPWNWKKGELAVLRQKSFTFWDVREISLFNINRLRNTRGKICGISTPYTTGGYGIELNTKIFYKCMRYLESIGYTIFNFPVLDIAIRPLREKWCEEKGVKYCEPIFGVVYNDVFQFGGFEEIFRTSNWPSSDGCNTEDGLFKKFNINVSSFPEEEFKKILKSLNLE